jgi:phasin family protein
MAQPQEIASMQSAVRREVEQATTSVNRFIGQLSEAMGMAGQGGGAAQAATKQASHNLELLTEANSIMTRAWNEMSAEWSRMTTEQFERNTQLMSEMLRLRTPQELLALQTEIARQSFECALACSGRIAEMTSRMVQDASQAVARQHGA